MKHTNHAGAIVVNSQGKIIIVKNSGGSWSFPKGHIEADESARDAAIRELAEETGITDAEMMAELGSYERPAWDGSSIKKMNMYLFRSDVNLLAPMDPVMLGARWVTLSEAIKTLTYKKDIEFLESCSAKVNALGSTE